MTTTDLPQSVRDAITYSSDTGSPVLAALRDIIAATPGRDGGELSAARVLLAAHARELSGALDQHYTRDRAGHPSGSDAYHRRGGIVSAMQVLDRYADDLDAAATDGAS